MKRYQENGFYVLEMKYLKIASKNKDYIDEEELLRKEKCLCKKNSSSLCGYCNGYWNPRKKLNFF